MDLNSIKASFFGIDSSLFKLFDNKLNVILSHFFRNRVVLFSKEMRSFNTNRTRSNGGLSTNEIRYNCSTTMEKLEKNLTSLFMNFLSNFFPSFNLFFRKNTSSSREGIRISTDGTTFCDDCTELSSLRVVFSHQIIWNTSFRVCSKS